jgi:hypothetical protein
MSESESIWEIVKRWLQSLFPPHPTKEEALKPQPISETATPETISEAEPTPVTITEAREERLTSEPEPLGETFAFPQQEPTWKPYEEVSTSTVDCLIEKGVLTVEERKTGAPLCVAWYADGTCRKKISTVKTTKVARYGGVEVAFKTVGYEPLNESDKAKYGAIIQAKYGKEQGWSIITAQRPTLKELAETYGCPLDTGLIYE